LLSKSSCLAPALDMTKFIIEQPVLDTNAGKQLSQPATDV
jgi:hypothetical protein